MKTGRFINIGYHRNVKIGYGTVDHINLKTIYIKLSAWVEPSDVESEYKDILFLSKKRIKTRIQNLRLPYFKPLSIVDTDLKVNRVHPNKRSYLNIEITLYVDNTFDVKSKEIFTVIKSLCTDIIDTDLRDKNLFNFHKTKK